MELHQLLVNYLAMVSLNVSIILCHVVAVVGLCLYGFRDVKNPAYVRCVVALAFTVALTTVPVFNIYAAKRV